MNQTTKVTVNKAFRSVMKYVFEFLPILLMFFLQVFISSEYISYTNTDFCISLIQIIIVDTSATLCFNDRISFSRLSTGIYILILIASSILFVLLQTPLMDESNAGLAYIVICIMFLISIIIKIVSGKVGNGV